MCVSYSGDAQVPSSVPVWHCQVSSGPLIWLSLVCISIKEDTHTHTHSVFSPSFYCSSPFFPPFSPPSSLLRPSSVSSSLLCGISSQKPVPQPDGDLTGPFCRSAIRGGSCRRKATSEGTSGEPPSGHPDPEPAIYLRRHTRPRASSSLSAPIWKQQRGGKRSS